MPKTSNHNISQTTRKRHADGTYVVRCSFVKPEKSNFLLTNALISVTVKHAHNWRRRTIISAVCPIALCTSNYCFSTLFAGTYSVFCYSAIRIVSPTDKQMGRAKNGNQGRKEGRSCHKQRLEDWQEVNKKKRFQSSWVAHKRAICIFHWNKHVHKTAHIFAFLSWEGVPSRIL